MGSNGLPGQCSGKDKLGCWEQRFRFPPTSQATIIWDRGLHTTVTMETTTKTIEAEKTGMEEIKTINTDLVKANVPVIEETKSEKIVSSKDDSEQKQDTKIESNDSEDTGFEIITPDLPEKMEDAKTKPDAASIAVKEPVITTTKEQNLTKLQETKEKDIVEEKVQKKEETTKASLIDIKVIKEPDDTSNKDSPESDAQNSEELEVALAAIPELSSSVSKEILAKANDEEDKDIVDEIETKTEERPGGTLIDITVIEEAGHSFEAEVIEDNEDIKVIPSDDEDVIEYTLESRHILPFLTICVAFVAVFVGLIFYYN